MSIQIYASSVLASQYKVKPSDNLKMLAVKFGYSDPGPIFAFPQNNQWLKKRNPIRVMLGDTLIIPWNRSDLIRLKKSINKSKSIVNIGYKHDITKQISDHQQSIKHDIFLDLLAGALVSLSLCFTTAAGAIKAGYAINRGAYQLGGAFSKTEKSLLAFTKLAETDIHTAKTVINVIDVIGLHSMTFQSMFTPAPTYDTKNFVYYLRHAFPLNPSFIKSILKSIQKSDIEIYMYGRSAILSKEIAKINQKYRKKLNELELISKAVDRQLSMPFYGHRMSAQSLS